MDMTSDNIARLDLSCHCEEPVRATWQSIMKLLSNQEMHEVFSRWQAANPKPASELDYVNAFTLLVAVVLSAQTTDKGVNKATGPL